MAATPTRVLVLGSNGMSGRALRALVAEDAAAAGAEWTFADRSHADLRDLAATTALFVAQRPTHIINLAANVGGIAYNILEPVALLEDNLRLATAIVGAAHAAGVQHMVSVLSTCIFPIRHEASFDETVVFDGPPHVTNAGYAYAKRALLSLCQAYATQYGRAYVCVVPPNLYGAHDKFDHRAHVVGALCAKFLDAEAAATARAVKVFGTGAAYRQFLYAPDFARLLLWALFNYHDTQEPLLMTPDDEVAVRDVVAAIADQCAPDIRVEWDATQPDGQLHKFGRNAKLKRALPGFVFTPLRDGIAATVAWLRSARSCRAK